MGDTCPRCWRLVLFTAAARGALCSYSESSLCLHSRLGVGRGSACAGAVRVFNSCSIVVALGAMAPASWPPTQWRLRVHSEFPDSQRIPPVTAHSLFTASFGDGVSVFTAGGRPPRRAGIQSRSPCFVARTRRQRLAPWPWAERGLSRVRAGEEQGTLRPERAWRESA
eukprot:scaffold27764_cov90-Isochrysis_galbana.AAC.1